MLLMLIYLNSFSKANSFNLYYEKLKLFLQSLKNIHNFLLNNNSFIQGKLLLQLIEIYINKTENDLKAIKEFYSEKHINESYCKLLQITFNEIVKNETSKQISDNINQIQNNKNNTYINQEDLAEVNINNQNSNFNLTSYQEYQMFIEESYKQYKNVSKLKQELNLVKNEYVYQHIENEFQFIFNNNVHINTNVLAFKSVYFKNLVSIKSNNFNFDSLDLEISEELQNIILDFLKKGTCIVQNNNIFPLLELSNYFMIDKLTLAIESFLENKMICLDNILCL
jgi:hypothetical protein